ncbi:unnamed protein product, partial [Mesorhabditis belari]|uniref:Uncharacterized protein n=1 Tax=Mesorhabditis belari TaxID=2138241 RepID=A0AAF3J1L7_9BILA
MLFLFFSFFILHANAITECDVYPCSRDVIIVIDSTVNMLNDANVKLQIDFVKSLISGWNLGNDNGLLTRVAIVGNGILEIIDTTDYLTDGVGLQNTLNRMANEASLYGLSDFRFNQLMDWINRKYNTNYPYPARDLNKVEKRILVFTPENQTSSIASAQASITNLTNNNFKISLIAITPSKVDLFNSLTGIQKKFSITNLNSIPSTLKNDLIQQAVCSDQKTTCPTMTSPATTTPGALPTVSSSEFFVNCSCTASSLWLDIVVVIDTSKSMGKLGLAQVQSDVASLMMWLTVDSKVAQASRIGIVTFSKSAKVQNPLGSLATDDDVINALFNLQATTDEHLDLVTALDYAELTMEKGGKGNPKVILLYSSAYNEQGDPESTAAQLKESGYTIITMAVEKSGQTDVVRHLSKLASPNMGFDSVDTDSLHKVVDAFCQANCFCKRGWEQLSYNERRYGECLWHSATTASWNTAMSECQKLDAHEASQLIYLNSKEKENFTVTELAHNAQGIQFSFHVGLRYETTISGYQWINGVKNLPYTNWDTNYPDSSKGYCIDLYRNSGFRYTWRNEDCTTNLLNYICQAQACDSDHYCPPN